jgi:thioredoxin-related protein
MRLEHKRHAFGGEGGFLRAVPQNSSDDSRQVMNQENGYRSWRIDKYHVLMGFESEGTRYCALLPLQP